FKEIDLSMQLAHLQQPSFEPVQEAPDVSVVLAAWNEGDNIGALIRRINRVLAELHLSFEVIVIDGGSTDKTVAHAEAAGARCYVQRRIGYGGAVREGFERARGQYVLTMDCDLSHPPELAAELWREREHADIVVGSRFVPGGDSEAPLMRRWMSIVLNIIFSKLLHVPIRDTSSGYRLYRRNVLKPGSYTRENFNILQEILVGAYADGFSIKELPLKYEERKAGASHVSLLKFCVSYLPTLYRLWLLRNSTDSADYDARAYNSRHFLQRYWQRRRVALLQSFATGTEPAADVGCGSSYFIQNSPRAIALDSAFHKLRFLSKSNKRRVQARLPYLPFATGSLAQLTCSQVLQSLPPSNAPFRELNRVMQRNGILVVSIPDSGRIQWRLIGWLYHHLLPNVYADEPAAYSRSQISDKFAEHGFRILRYAYICGAELVLKLQKIQDIE
ncbi:MAG: glycosyltransferase, partial [Oligoflexia bacterium]|nr:glycosyltransferase [Oligoflexia bacterium]